MLDLRVIRMGLLNQFSSFHRYLHISIPSKYLLSIDYHIYILTDRCNCQMEHDLHDPTYTFAHLKYLCFGWNSERSFSCNCWPQGPDASLDNMMFTAKWQRTYHRAAYLYTFWVFCTQKWQYEICTPYKGICTHKLKSKFLLEFQLLPWITGFPKRIHTVLQ